MGHNGERRKGWRTGSWERELRVTVSHRTHSRITCRHGGGWGGQQLAHRTLGDVLLAESLTNHCGNLQRKQFGSKKMSPTLNSASHQSEPRPRWGVRQRLCELDHTCIASCGVGDFPSPRSQSIRATAPLKAHTYALPLPSHASRAPRALDPTSDQGFLPYIYILNVYAITIKHMRVCDVHFLDGPQNGTNEDEGCVYVWHLRTARNTSPG